MEETLSPLEEATLRRDWRTYTLLTFLFTFGFSLYNGPFQNFLRDVLNARELDLGRLESLREIPGLLAALTAGTLVALAESRVAALGLIVGAIGIACTGFFRTMPSQIAVTVLWSIGFHLYVTVSSPITLALARGKEGGRHLGRMSAVGAAATLGGLATAYAIARLAPGWYDGMFWIAGALILVSGVLCLRLSPLATHGKRERLIWRKEYSLFYWLTFLEGCRRQIFSIFASFTLILVYKVPVQQMILLQLVNQLLIWVTAPRIGKLVDRKGERGPLVFYAVGLIVVFLGYALVRNKEALMVLYLLDNVLFTFGVGLTTYLHRIVRPGEITPCIAMGVTMNHIAAVTVPFFGALLWKETGNYQTPFWVGVFIAAVSLVSTQRLPVGPASKSSI